MEANKIEVNKITETIIGAAIEVHRTLGPGLHGVRLRGMFGPRIEIKTSSI
jgi:hypothetical protein